MVLVFPKYLREVTRSTESLLLASSFVFFCSNVSHGCLNQQSEIKKETNFIQIQNGVLGSDCKTMTVLLTLSLLVTCIRYVKAHAESA